MIENKQDEQAFENQNYTSELQKKLHYISDIEKEHYYTQEKVKQVGNSIEKLKLELMADNAEKTDLQQLLTQLITERNDLLNKLDHLTMKYDECVREISHDRADMEAHNKQHAKLVTAKILFQQLEQIAKNKLKTGLEDIKSYCRFDMSCHTKLKSFAYIMERLGTYKLKVALNQWYSNALKPVSCKLQSAVLAEKAYDDQLKHKIFYKWLTEY